MFIWRVEKKAKMMILIMWGMSNAPSNYTIFWDCIKCVLPPLTEVVGPANWIHDKTHHFCKRRKYAFNVLSEYLIIFPNAPYKFPKIKVLLINKLKKENIYK